MWPFNKKKEPESDPIPVDEEYEEDLGADEFEED